MKDFCQPALDGRVYFELKGDRVLLTVRQDVPGKARPLGAEVYLSLECAERLGTALCYLRATYGEEGS